MSGQDGNEQTGLAGLPPRGGLYFPLGHLNPGSAQDRQTPRSSHLSSSAVPEVSSFVPRCRAEAKGAGRKG